MPKITFVVEQAGCDSCAALVLDALAPLVDVDSVSVDEATVTATVVATAADAPTADVIDAALAAASPGSAHAYRLRPGSLGPV